MPGIKGFPIPEGFELPEEVKVGDTFAAMAELRLDANNMLTLVSLEGSECSCGEGGDSEDEDESESESEANFLGQVEIKFGKASLG
jgi:hypothetical protein